jgi:hypothetical protein
MSQYFADFIGYIDEQRRPENFPHEVHVHEQYGEIENIEHLKAVVNDRFVKLVTSAGLVVLKDPSEILDSVAVTFDRRRYIPWSMITHMEVKVTLIPEPPSPQDKLIPIEPTPAAVPKERVN